MLDWAPVQKASEIVNTVFNESRLRNERVKDHPVGDNYTVNASATYVHR
jgi:hypothetical protein